MRVGLDGIPLAFPRTGVGHYTFELAHALAAIAPSDQFELIYPSTFPPLDISGPILPNLRLVRVDIGPLSRHWWSFGLPRFIRRLGLDLFHGTNYEVPLWHRCPTVLTVHDMSLFLHPATHLKRNVRRARRRLPLMLRAADATIVCAGAVKRELAATIGKGKKIEVVPEAARKIFTPMSQEEAATIRERLGVGANFIFAVGTIEPRKNLGLLIEAFERVGRRDAFKRIQLVIAGGKGWLSDSVFERIRKSSCSDRIVMTDYLNDEDLRGLYSSCKVFIYPSLYEGFGLPPLEAMGCGAPVIVSNIPVLLETTGGFAAAVDPNDPAHLEQELIALLTNEAERTRLAIEGRNWAARFNWEQTARQTLEVYRRIL